MNIPESFVIANIYNCNLTATRIESVETIEEIDNSQVNSGSVNRGSNPPAPAPLRPSPERGPSILLKSLILEKKVVSGEAAVCCLSRVLFSGEPVLARGLINPIVSYKRFYYLGWQQQSNKCV